MSVDMGTKRRLMPIRGEIGASSFVEGTAGYWRAMSQANADLVPDLQVQPVEAR